MLTWGGWVVCMYAGICSASCLGGTSAFCSALCGCGRGLWLPVTLRMMLEHRRLCSNPCACDPCACAPHVSHMECIACEIQCHGHCVGLCTEGGDPRFAECFELRTRGVHMKSPVHSHCGSSQTGMSHMSCLPLREDCMAVHPHAGL